MHFIDGKKPHKTERKRAIQNEFKNVDKILLPQLPGKIESLTTPMYF